MKSFLNRCLCISMLLIAMAPGVHAAETVEFHWINELMNAIWEPIQDLATELVGLLALEVEADGPPFETLGDETQQPQEIGGGIEPIG